jgi:hypothetical protein
MRCTTWSESWDAGVNGSSPKDAAQPQRKATFYQEKNGTYMLSVGWNCFRQILGRGLCLLRGRRVGDYPFVALAAMHSGVACRAQRDQVLL